MIGGLFRRTSKVNLQSECPNCSLDIGFKGLDRRLRDKCPYCGEPLLPVWWQRLLIAILGLLLSILGAASLGLSSLALLLAALVCWFPATALAYILVLSVIPPQYVRRTSSMTLFGRR